MKRIFGVIALVCAVAMSSCSSKFDDGDLWNNINGLEDRVSKLEEQCKAMNTNIASLQTIVKALQNQKTVTKVEQTADGCTIHFSDGTTAVIRNGKDSGSAPVVSIRQDADGNYYWTLNGDYILVDGQKVKAQGTDGKDGQDGTDGKDGVTPQLKIDSGYWYITYDNGATWTRLGKATGENGKDGADGKDGLNGQDGKDGTDGKDGRDGDGIKVSQDDSNVYFELNDGTKITIPKSNDITSIVDKVKSITFVPQYTDGKVEVLRESEEADGSAELDFLISPKEVVTELTAVWEQAVTVKAVYTKARSTKAVKFVDMPVTAFTADAKTGVVTVKVSGENLGDDFYAGKKEANAMLFISDGNTSRTSDYAPIYGKNDLSLVDDLYTILYITSDNQPLSAEIESQAGFVSNTYENGQGTIRFDHDIVELCTNAFKDCKTLTSITLPSNLQTIGLSAFQNCTNLINIIIPDNVTNIGADSFAYCNNLHTITIGQGVTIIGEDILRGCDKLEHIYGKFTSEDNRCLIFDNELRYCASYGLTEYTIPNNITSIGRYAFSNCQSLTNIVIPNGVVNIGYSAFYKCQNLVSVTIPNSIKNIGYTAFAYCNIIDLIIPNSVETIDQHAFLKCQSLNSLIINGTGQTVIKEGAFKLCTSLKTVEISGVRSTDVFIFRDCSSLEKISFLDDIEYIGQYLCLDCTSLKEVYVKSTTPHELRSDAFTYTTYNGVMENYQKLNCKIYVPTIAIDAYKSAVGWKEYASQIVGYDF